MSHNEVRRIFITGGASGLGQALALRYAKAGWKVCVGDIQEERGRRICEDLSVLGVHSHFLLCDVTQESDLVSASKWLEENWNGVDVIINNAGVAVSGWVADTPLADWQWIIDINLLGVVRGCKAFIPIFKRQGHGHIVNIASMAGLVHPPFMAPYNATKAGVVALSETLAFELKKDGIGVSVSCPSFFRTHLTENLRSSDAINEQLAKRLVTQAKKSSSEVADLIYRGVQKRDFLILTHSEGKLAWAFKRLLSARAYQKVFDRVVKANLLR